MDNANCKILPDTGANESFMSKGFYLSCPSLHILCKFIPKTKEILVANSQNVGVLFVIPAVINLQGHRFEVYKLVSEIHDNVDMVKGIRMCMK